MTEKKNKSKGIEFFFLSWNDRTERPGDQSMHTWRADCIIPTLIPATSEKQYYKLIRGIKCADLKGGGGRGF